MRSLFVVPVLFAACCTLADFVRESARELPVAADVDVLVVGGSAGAVCAAVGAEEAGASVYLAAPRPYLGEELAGTLRLALPDGEKPQSLLAQKLFTKHETVADYTYKANQRASKPHTDDFSDKLRDGRFENASSDTVQYSNDVRIACSLGRKREVASVELVSFLAKNDYDVKFVRMVVSEDGKKWDGPIYFSAATNENMVVWSAKVDREISGATIAAVKQDGAKRLLISQITFRIPDKGPQLATPTPLHVKKTLDAELVSRGIPFLTGTYATDVLVDEKGNVRGIAMANRSGRQAILAKHVIDATERFTVAKLAGAKAAPFAAGKHTFERIVIATNAPSAKGMSVKKLSGEYPAIVSRGWRHAGKGMTGYAWLCSLDLPMADGTHRSFCKAEQLARDATFVSSQLDAADTLFRPQEPAPTLLPEGLSVLPLAPIQREIAAGYALGKDASQAVSQKTSVIAVRTAKLSGKHCKGEVRELLNGLRPYRKEQRTVFSGERDLPVLGEWDVVVVGGGTSGAPAAIGAARGGAKTLLVEYLNVLGGIGTEGMIGIYCYGNICGFTKEHDKALADLKADVYVQGKAEVWRREARDAGAEIWFGTMACGTIVENGKTTGVVVATPDGRGVVLAKNVVDATGNADLAAASGAACVFQNSSEIAVQGAGFSPQQLGASYINTDFGYVNDGDAEDLWLFGVRARAGAKNEWDLSQLAGSRERRRIVGETTVSCEDAVNGRTFPDTVLVTRANFDSHGYSVDDICYISEPDGKKVYNVNVPWRALLPKGMDGLAVVGLGASCHRDVMPMVRMQPDLQNMGYAAGLGAAMASENGRNLRDIDVRKLQKKLVSVGNLRPEVLAWQDNNALSSEALALAVRDVGSSYHNISKVLAHRKEAMPLLRGAYDAAETEAAKEIYAHVLGILGDATGAKTLADVVSGTKRPSEVLPNEVAFGRRMDEMGSFIIALGRTRAECARVPLITETRKLTPASAFRRYRALSLAWEAMADPAGVQCLTEALQKTGVMGHAQPDGSALKPLGGYGGNGEMQLALRELGLARALLRCGDPDGLARKIIGEYAKDARGIFAMHATALLKSAKK